MIDTLEYLAAVLDVDLSRLGMGDLLALQVVYRAVGEFVCGDDG